MLKKFVTIKNVSRFKNFSACGDIELKRLSLLFAENGRGKTTLCAVLRSLQSGVGAHVIGRTTLGSTDAPEIRILSDGRTFSFGSGAWEQHPFRHRHLRRDIRVRERLLRGLGRHRPQAESLSRHRRQGRRYPLPRKSRPSTRPVVRRLLTSGKRLR